MNLANWLHQTAQSWPDRPAVYSGDDLRHSYGSLLRAVCARARSLREEHGVGRGDRVAIFAKNAPEIIELLHACWWVGAVVVPVNNKLHPREAAWIVENAEAALAFTDTGDVFSGDVFAEAGAIREASIFSEVAPIAGVEPPEDLADEELAWLFYTSGTTGKPKGVMLSHYNLREMALSYALDVDPPTPGDHVLYAAPMSHGAGLYMFAHIRAGCAHVVPTSRGFDSQEVMALAKSRGGLVFFAAPTMVKRLIEAARQADYSGEGVRTVIYGGGPMYAKDIDEALALFGPRFVQVYGQGESPMTISVLSRAAVADESQPRWREKRNSVGVPQAGVAVAVCDADGRALRPGETGEIRVKGPTVMLGYWRNPEATAATVQDGWLLTGDLGHLDEDGFLHLTDRSKDVIVSGGTNIYPREVEEALLSHPAIFEVAVVGEPEREWGEQVVAFVVTKQNKSIEPVELDQWCKRQIAGFKRPKRYVFADELPKNSYGKILKTELRAEQAKRRQL